MGQYCNIFAHFSDMVSRITHFSWVRVLSFLTLTILRFLPEKLGREKGGILAPPYSNSKPIDSKYSQQHENA
jgi:hypothetical protein